MCVCVCVCVCVCDESSTYIMVKMTQYSEVASGNRQGKVHSDSGMVGPAQLMMEATLSLLNNLRISYFNFNGDEILEFKRLLFVGLVGWFGLVAFPKQVI